MTPAASRPSGARRTAEPFSLGDRVALVTGGASGIGAEAAATLASWGARVAFTHRPGSRSEEELRVVAEQLAGDAGEAVPVALDVRSPADVERAVSEVTERLGRIDVLVNSAGTNVPQDALDVDEATWDLITDTNLKGAFFVSQAVARAMSAQGTAPPGGYSIVQVASQMGFVGFRQRAAYCASKAGLVNLTRVLAIEWAPLGIRVNAVAPTFITTPLAETVIAADPGFRDEILERSPMHEIGTPSDVAGGILYLASPASRLVTGTTLAIDGGWTSW